MNRRDALKLIGVGTAGAALGLAAPQPEVVDDFKLTEFTYSPYTGHGWDQFLNWMTRYAQPQECHRQYVSQAKYLTPTFRGNLTSVVGPVKSGKTTVMTALAQHWNRTKDQKVWSSGFVPSGVSEEKQLEFAKALVNREHPLTRGKVSHLNVLLEHSFNRQASQALLAGEDILEHPVSFMTEATWAVADVSICVERAETGRMAADIPGGRRCDGMRITVVSNRWGPAGDRFYICYQDVQAQAMNLHIASWGYNLQWYSHIHQQLEDHQNELTLKGKA